MKELKWHCVIALISTIIFCITNLNSRVDTGDKVKITGIYYNTDKTNHPNYKYRVTFDTEYFNMYFYTNTFYRTGSIVQIKNSEICYVSDSFTAWVYIITTAVCGLIVLFLIIAPLVEV